MNIKELDELFDFSIKYPNVLCSIKNVKCMYNPASQLFSLYLYDEKIIFRDASYNDSQKVVKFYKNDNVVFIMLGVEK